MESNKIFKKVEVVGLNKEEAKDNAPFKLRINATTAYEKWRKTADNVGDTAVTEWMKEYLKSKKYNTAGDGAYIVLQAGVNDTRKKPYKVNKIKHDAKTHTPQLMYVIRDSQGQVYKSFKKSAEAIAAAKDFVTDMKETARIFREGVIKEGNAEYAVVEYTPSKNTQNCILLCFGYIAVD